MNNTQKNIFIDSHVHLYDNFDPDSFIESVTRNFRKYGQLEEHEFGQSIKMIFLTESKDNDFFTRMKDNSLRLKNIDIHSEKTGEKDSILLKQNGSDLFYVIRGRQIVTEENVEILSVGSGPKIRDGLPAAEVLEHIRENEQLAILAWGVGKWLFGRGKVIRNIINTLDYPMLLIGDNSARPSVWARPLIYRKGEKKGIPVIGGSDPLPLDGEEQKAGSYFFLIKGKFDPASPLGSIKDILGSEIRDLKLLGKRDSFFHFLKRQYKILSGKYLK